MDSPRPPAPLPERRSAPAAPEHQWRLFHVAGACFAAAMRAVPRRRRFGAALLAARTLGPLIRRTGAYRVLRTATVDRAGEIAAYLVLHVLTKHGVAFDPVIPVDGYGALAAALADGGGVLVVGSHAALNLLMVRRFHDDGYEPVVVSADPLMRVPGTPIVVETVQPSPTFLVATRNRLRGGRLVCGMPDRGEHHPGRTLEFDTPNGSVIVAPALLRVASRSGVRVVFTEVHLERGGLAGTIRVPASDTADGLTREFVEFIGARTEPRPGVRGGLEPRPLGAAAVGSVAGGAGRP
jgi:hypothetical protein